jgi:hypothetical protein
MREIAERRVSEIVSEGTGRPADPRRGHQIRRAARSRICRAASIKGFASPSNGSRSYPGIGAEVERLKAGCATSRTGSASYWPARTARSIRTSDAAGAAGVAPPPREE